VPGNGSARSPDVSAWHRLSNLLRSLQAQSRARSLRGCRCVLPAVAVTSVATITTIALTGKRIKPEHTLGRSGSRACVLDHGNRPYPLSNSVIGQACAPAPCRQWPTLHDVTTASMRGCDLVRLLCAKRALPLEENRVLECAALRRCQQLGCRRLRGCCLLRRGCRLGCCGRGRRGRPRRSLCGPDGR
jgi:hypothetical protein